MRISDLQLSSPFLAAPLAGVSCAAWRLTARRHGAALVYTEMVSAAGLLRRQSQTTRLLHSLPGERPLALQLFGAKPQEMLKASALLRSLPLDLDLMDINMGCPVRKVRRQGAGSALLSQPTLAAELVAAAREGWDGVVTAKVRLGEDRDDLRELIPGLVKAGAAAITLHARTARQGFAGRADWEAIRRLKTWCPVPVIGNGDVTSPEEAVGMLARTGCDGVMIGRGALGNPWVFGQAVDLLHGRPPRRVSLHDRRAALLDQWVLTAELSSPYLRLHHLRQAVMFYVRGLPGAPVMRRAAASLKDPENLRAMVLDFFAELGAGEGQAAA